ncbi:MAG: MFS transporter [Chloroflexi bacterium]|nr:MFS transporter [Chloroflexota bacterium]
MLFNRKSTRIFYGWWIVGAAFLIAMYCGGVVFYGFTAIFEPIANDMGWSYAQISLAASLRGLELGLLAPLTGILTDRLGPRRLIFAGAIITALGLFLLSRTTSLATFYGAFALIAIGMSATTLTVLMTAVASWFRLKVGIACGIAMSGFGFSGLLVPLIVKLIDIFDWRMTISILAAGVLAIVLPLSFVFRHRPEQYGYQPDGLEEASSPLSNTSTATQSPKSNFRVTQVLRSVTFWRIAMTFMVHVILISSVITHIMPYLSSIGMDRTRAGFVAMILPILSVGGRLGFGWLADRSDRRRVASIAFGLITIGLFCFGSAPSAGLWLLVPFLFLFGVGYGGSTGIRPSLVVEYFGRANFGSIFGFIVGINALGGIVGPFLAGWVFDTWGSYQGVWLASSGLAVAAVLLIYNVSPVKIIPESDTRD